MRDAFKRPAMLMLGVLAAHASTGHSQQAAVVWLDEGTIASWNAPGQAIPPAPKVQNSVDPRCRERARPHGEEDKRVREQGWDLIGAFQGGWQVLVVRGAAGYDGMCRPIQYQDFVFAGGNFAGTLAPAPINSRTDGALGRVSLPGPEQLIAEYSRSAGFTSSNR